MHDTLDTGYIYQTKIEFLEKQLRKAQEKVERLEKEVISLKQGQHYLIDQANTSKKYRAATLHKVQEENSCQSWLKEAGITNYHVFPQSLNEVIQAITEQKTIDDIAIFEKIKEPDFRFYTRDEPTLSLSTSTMIAQLMLDARKPAIELAETGRQARTDKADNFALSMHNIIHKELGADNIKSFRQAARLLEEKEIPTPSSNGKWQAATLTELNKRWEKLGLSPLVPKSK